MWCFGIFYSYLVIILFFSPTFGLVIFDLLMAICKLEIVICGAYPLTIHHLLIDCHATVFCALVWSPLYFGLLIEAFLPGRQFLFLSCHDLFCNRLGCCITFNLAWFASSSLFLVFSSSSFSIPWLTRICFHICYLSFMKQLKLWIFLICFALGFDSSEGKKCCVSRAYAVCWVTPNF